MRLAHLRPVITMMAGGALNVSIWISVAAAADIIRQTAPLAPAPVVSNDPNRHFYVRGDVGIGRNSFGRFSQPELTANGGSFISRSIADTVHLGAGIGWQINSRFRFDLTGEYRASAQVKAMDDLNVQLIGPAGALQANTLYQGQMASYAGLLNAYWDIFNWRGFTPYLGAGAGLALNSLQGFTTSSAATFTDAGTGVQTFQLSNGAARNRSQANLAWALMAGTSYGLSPNAKLDLGYRYLNLGPGATAATGLISCTCGAVGGPLKLSRIASHELRMGIRWALNAEPRYPVITAKY